MLESSLEASSQLCFALRAKRQVKMAGPVNLALGNKPVVEARKRCPKSQEKALQLVLAVGLDGHIRGGIGHASEAESLAHLIVVQEGLVALVNAA